MYLAPIGGVGQLSKSGHLGDESQANRPVWQRKPIAGGQQSVSTDGSRTAHHGYISERVNGRLQSSWW